jgi:hypothetical protein
MSDASAALQSALHAALAQHAPLIALLGGARVYDVVPRSVEVPYVSFGQTLERDWGTGGEEGSEHTVTLHVWSRAPGRREALVIARAVRAALHDRPLGLEGHRLVNLRHEFSEVRRDSDGETFHGIVRLRAVTEPVT